MMARIRRKSTAYHEAGHAVIGRVLDLACGHATVEADHDSTGHAITSGPWATVQLWQSRGKDRSYESALRGRILAYMAGAEAERELLGRCTGGDGDDRYQITLMFDSLLPADADLGPHEAKFREKCCWLIHRHRATIERVAKALLAHRHLSARELDKLVPACRVYSRERRIYRRELRRQWGGEMPLALPRRR